jgi:hypothetical protein
MTEGVVDIQRETTSTVDCKGEATGASRVKAQGALEAEVVLDGTDADESAVEITGKG